VAGKTVPINYNILQDSLVGILADPARHSLDVVVNPGPSGGALEIQIPRYLIDSKTPASTIIEPLSYNNQLSYKIF
jgi:hypothetical protein